MIAMLVALGRNAQLRRHPACPCLKLFLKRGTVTIKGRYLRELLRHCAICIQERHISEFEAREGDPYINRIEFGPVDLALLSRRPT